MLATRRSSGGKLYTSSSKRILSPQEIAEADARQKLANAPQLVSALAAGLSTGVLHAGFAELPTIPRQVLTQLGSRLVRLDLGYNNLTWLPKEVGCLTRLEQIWLNDNPNLAELPDGLADCTKLRVIDVRATSMKTLPFRLGTLERIRSIDLRENAMLDAAVRQAYEDQTSQDPSASTTTACTIRLMAYLKHQYTTTQLKAQLEERFRNGMYREICEKQEGIEAVRQVIEMVFTTFTSVNDIKDIIRNCERLFPVHVDPKGVNSVLERFASLRRDNERKKLGAKLELKLRAHYYDRIDPAKVEGIVRDLYAQIAELKDIKFLIKFAAKLLPPESNDIDAEIVFREMRALQRHMAEERAAAIEVVAASLRIVYSHVEPKYLGELAAAVGTHFKKVEDLKKLAADAVQYFPSEFEVAMTDPRSVRAAFLSAEAE